MTTYCSGATWILPKLELLSNGADGSCWKFNDDFLFWVLPNLPHILPYHILILLNYQKNCFPLYIVFQFFYCINWISYSWPPSEFWPRKDLNPRFPLLPYRPVLTILKYSQILVSFHLFKTFSLHCIVIKHLKVLKSEKSQFCVQSPKQQSVRENLMVTRCGLEIFKDLLLSSKESAIFGLLDTSKFILHLC